MTFLQQLLGHSPGTSLSADEERYWTSVYNSVSAAGVRVGPETALKLSTVWACDRLLAETIASLPALVFERLADGGRQRATNHPLYDVLHRQPNEQQTAFEFFDFMSHCAIMRGNGYARIKPGARGFADQLVPLHPDRIMPEKLPDGGLRYKVTNPNAPMETLNDEDVLHLRGPSFDGVLGVSVVTYARESLGLALAAERYGAKYFGNNSQPGGVLSKKEGKLSPEAATRIKASWEAAHSGDQIHRIAVLEEGLTWQQVGVHNKDSQFLETREFQAEDICRWFRVPPHLVGLTSKVTSWGSGIEQLGLGFVIYTLMPWLVRWQQAISRDLILAPDKYFVEFLVDALLRGDLKSRYDAYAIGRQWGWLSRNDVRRTENMNPIEGGDDYLSPLNMSPQAAAFEGETPAFISGPSHAHYEQLLYEAAGRVVRKEIAAITKAYGRLKRHSDWAAVVQEFYGDHALFVAQTLRIDVEIARRYVTEQMAELQNGPEVMADWETRRVVDLVALVLGESNRAAADAEG